MPIYDHNGSDLTQIKYLYEHNGSSLVQDKYAYDHNGSAFQLVYSSDIQFYPGTTPEGGTTYEGGNAASMCSWSGLSIGVYSHTGNYAVAYAYITINLTGISYLQVTYTWYKQLYSTIFIGLSSNFRASPGFIWNTPKVQTIVWYDGSEQSLVTNTITLDVRSLSGYYQLGGIARAGSSVSANAGFSITSVIGLP